jgi:hypothetical protein
MTPAGPRPARRDHRLQVLHPQVVGDPHARLGGRGRPVPVVVAERRWLWDLVGLVEPGVFVIRQPGTVRRLVVDQRAEWPAGVARLDPADRQVGDQIGRIPLEPARPAQLEHLRVVVGALVGEDAPVVEPARVVDAAMAQMPLAHQRRLVAGRLEQPREPRLTRVEQGRQGQHPVDVVVGAGQDRRPARRAQRVGAEAVGEAHPLGGQPVDPRRLVDPAPVAADGVRHGRRP